MSNEHSIIRQHIVHAYIHSIAGDPGLAGSVHLCHVLVNGPGEPSTWQHLQEVSADPC